ncbi:MAG: O-antigen ligase family protein [Pseudobdellovibrionaceae bacterium]
MVSRPPALFRLCQFLLFLAFFSKISFEWTGLVPYQFSYLIFQHGIHPFVNFALVAVLAPFVVFHWRRWRKESRDKIPKFNGVYRFFVFALSAVLAVQTVLQIFFLESEPSSFMQLGALGFTFLLILLYGVIMPQVMTAAEFIELVLKWTVALTLFSLVLWLLGAPSVFKGNRFIGTFKHIPHMVTCATTASIFYLLRVFSPSANVVQKSFRLLIWTLLIFAVVLTGTRTSLAAALGSFLFAIFLFQKSTSHVLLFRILAASVFSTTLLFFGPSIYDYLHGLAKGEVSLGQREAQDGFESRWEEVERGLEIAKESPHIGLGLLSKFHSGGGTDVDTYNSFRDPHNIFVSAMVIGGWPLGVLTLLFLVALLVASLRGLFAKDFARRVVALFLFSHFLILIIYHWHFSIGGMADRLYWFAFGMLALQITPEKSTRPIRSSVRE